MPTLSASLTTATLTALFGIIVFVAGQIAIRFLLDPLQDQAKTIGRIAHSLTYYGNVTDLAPPELREEARQAYRDQAASLRTSINVIPMYAHLARLGLVTISKGTSGADDGTTARYRRP